MLVHISGDRGHFWTAASSKRMRMMPDTEPNNAPWDQLVIALQDFRRSVGDPSYAVIAQRIGQLRIDQGANAFEARVARSSVHSAFQTGRQRINLSFIREIASAIDANDALVAQWVAACQKPALPEQMTEKPTNTLVLFVVFGCVALNLMGREFVDFFGLPLYLDMVGTAIAALALGPWRGAAVGATTNIIGAIGSGWISVPFALVNIIGALVWGYGTRRFGMGRTLVRFFVLNIIAALACSIVAVPVLLGFQEADFRNGHDVVTQLVSESFDSFIVATSFSNLLTSSADKLLSGFAALVAISAMPAALRRDSQLILTDHRPPA